MRLWRNWQTRYLEGVVFTRRMGSSPINRTIYIYGVCYWLILQLNSYYADVAESADALVSGTSGSDIVEVQVLSSAPFFVSYACGCGGIGRRATLRG